MQMPEVRATQEPKGGRGGGGAKKELLSVRDAGMTRYAWESGRTTSA